MSEKISRPSAERIRNISASALLLMMTELQEVYAADIPSHTQESTVSEEQKYKILSHIGLDTIPGIVETIEVLSPSATGKYIVQIDQSHLSSIAPEESNPKTAEAQAEIGELIEHLLRKKQNLKICPESVMEAVELEEAKRELQKLESQLKDAPVDEAFEQLKYWIDLQYQTYGTNYAMKLQFEVAALFEKIFQDRLTKAQKDELQSLNPFGAKAEFIVGVVGKMYNEGTLNNVNILPCESYLISSHFGTLLRGLDDTPTAEYLKRFESTLQARETYISKTLSDYLNKTNDDYLVLVLGAIHDLSDNIATVNKTDDTDTGYIRIQTKTIATIIEEITKE